MLLHLIEGLELIVPVINVHGALYLQEIKKKKGIKDEVQLTSKQKELMHAQLEKESQIRKRLKEASFDLFCQPCSYQSNLW